MKEGWEITTIGKICDVIAGQSPEGKFYNYQGIGTPFYQGKKEYGIKYLGKPTTWTTKVTKVAEENDILISVRAPVGPINFATQKICIGRGLAAIRAKKDINIDFLFNFLLKHESEIVGNSGAVFNSINKAQIEAIKVPLPPLTEQQRIVAILDEAFAAIDKARANAEKNLNNANELFESYLQGVFENKGDGWEEMNLADVVEDSCTLSYGIVQPGEEFENGLPIVRPTDMTKRFIGLNGLKRINPELAEGYKRTKLRGDELLICVRGTTGLVSEVSSELKDANVTRGIVPIRFNPNVIIQDFGYYLLISHYVQSQIKSKTYGAALMQINIGDLRKISTPFPNLLTQLELVGKLDAILSETKRLESIYQQKLSDLEELKKSVLQKAFSGAFKTVI